MKTEHCGTAQREFICFEHPFTHPPDQNACHWAAHPPDCPQRRLYNRAFALSKALQALSFIWNSRSYSGQQHSLPFVSFYQSLLSLFQSSCRTSSNPIRPVETEDVLLFEISAAGSTLGSPRQRTLHFLPSMRPISNPPGIFTDTAAARRQRRIDWRRLLLHPPEHQLLRALLHG